MPTTTLLLVADDPVLRSEVARLAAAAGVGLDTVALHESTSAWTSTPAVLVGADALPGLLELGPVRRDGVWVACRGPADEARVLVLNYTDAPVTIAKSDRIAQAFVLKVPRVEFVPLEHEGTEQSRGGFGSTGT